MDDFIRIRGAREHNLRSIDLDIPRNRLVVITGLSGSGKSSLAFDTIYADGQRRYVESLSAFFSSAIAIERKTTSENPPSIMGTATDLRPSSASSALDEPAPSSCLIQLAHRPGKDIEKCRKRA
jgi:excinuclease ABC subunit A